MTASMRRNFILKLSCIASAVTVSAGLRQSLAQSKSFRLELIVNRARSILPYPVIHVAILDASGNVLFEAGSAGVPETWLRTNDFGGVSVSVDTDGHPARLVVAVLAGSSGVLTASCQMEAHPADTAYYLIEPLLRSLGHPQDEVHAAEGSSVLNADIVLAGIRIRPSPEFPIINSRLEDSATMGRT